MCKVSIIIPVYNVVRHIENSIRSALWQQFEEIEYIIIDDCGIDDSMQIVEQIISEYPNKEIKIISHQHNKGLSAARNTGIQVATGEFLFFMDSDDVISPDCIEQHVKALNKYPNAVFSDANTKVINGRNTFFRHENEYTLSGDDIIKAYLNGEMHVSAWNKLYRRDFIVRNNLKFKEGLIYEDLVWSFDVVHKADEMVCLPCETYHYIIHENSLTTSNSETKIRKQYDSWEYICHYALKQIPLYHKGIQQCIKKWLGGIRFKALARLSILDLQYSLKREYYGLLNQPDLQLNSAGFMAILAKLPYPLFMIVVSLPYRLFCSIKKYL